MLKQAAADAVAAGLKVVLNPFHRRLRVAVSSDTIRWIWGAVLQEFRPDEFPYDQVAFEMVRLPISYVQRPTVSDQVIRENPASRGTETSAEVLVGPPWRMESNAGPQQWYRVSK